jgi:hypothetical protein
VASGPTPTSVLKGSRSKACGLPTWFINGRPGKARTSSKRHRKRCPRLCALLNQRFPPRQRDLDGRPGKARTSSKRHRKRCLRRAD